MINWERTDPEKYVCLFSSISINNWGLTIDVIATDTDDDVVDGGGAGNSYKVSFIECRQISWEMFDPDEYDTISTQITIIGFDLGDEDYKTAAIINGGFFELAFKYKTRQITKL